MYKFWRPKRTYLDYAAATPVRPEIVSLMERFWNIDFANPSAIHTEGQRARVAVEDARLRLARSLQARPEGIVFTGSGTESNNLAISGVIEQCHQKGSAYNDIEVITTAIEHPSVTETLSFWKQKGVVVTVVKVTAEGALDVRDFEKKLSTQTKLVTLSYVNSEIGTITPLRKVSRLVAEFNKKNNANILVHSDAAQAPLWLSCNLSQFGVDLLSLDAGKCYGPKGVGVLALRHGVSLAPVLFGGGQESNLRPGTENTALIVGAVEALIVAQNHFKKRAEKISAVRDYAIEKLSHLPGLTLNGSSDDRVANNVNVSIDGIDGEFAAISLDVVGIACATRSACGSGKGTGSHVIREITGDEGRAISSLRLTLGEESTKREIDRVVAELVGHIKKVASRKN